MPFVPPVDPHVGLYGSMFRLFVCLMNFVACTVAQTAGIVGSVIVRVSPVATVLPPDATVKVAVTAHALFGIAPV